MYPRTRPRTRGGFTLVELLVAMAIFITVMGGVVVLFTSSVRLTKQGFQNQEAFELARGTLNLFERDLTKAFTARDHGDYHHFYGTPIGMTFIGALSSDDVSGSNLARYTYVVYHDQAAFNQNTQPVETLLDVDLDEVPTYHLLRFVEPGQEDLDSFPVDWQLSNGISTELVDACPTCPDVFDTSTLSPVQEEIIKAKKRELWIRMLAGGEADGVPSAWIIEAQTRQPGQSNELINLNHVPDLVETPDLDFPFDAADFAISENILHINRDRNGDVDLDIDGKHIFPNEPPLIKPPLSDLFASSHHVPFIDFQNPDSPSSYFFSYRFYGERNRTDPESLEGLAIAKDPLDGRDLRDNFGNNIIQREIVPIELAYWNDIRNIEYANALVNQLNNNGEDDDGDGVIDEFVNLLNSEPGEGVLANFRSGTPLVPTLPEEVTIQFTIFLESPYPGAPDFEKEFTQRIELPTGLRRSKAAPRTLLERM